MTQQMKDYLKFKVNQHMRLNNIEFTKENAESVLKNKILMTAFLKEACAANCDK